MNLAYLLAYYLVNGAVAQHAQLAHEHRAVQLQLLEPDLLPHRSQVRARVQFVYR